MKTYNRTSITQFNICKVNIEPNNKQKMCKLSVVPGNGQAVLGMPDIDKLNIIHINCNMIDTDNIDRVNNCSTNTAIYKGSRHEQHYINMIRKLTELRNAMQHRQNFRI